MFSTLAIESVFRVETLIIQKVFLIRSYLFRSYV